MVAQQTKHPHADQNDKHCEEANAPLMSNRKLLQTRDDKRGACRQSETDP